MRLLGVELGPREIRVARAERSLGRLRLTALERIPCEEGAGLEQALAGLARWRPDAVLTALSMARVTHRILLLPFRDRRRIARSAPLELLGQLPHEAEDALVACEPLGPAPGGTAVLAVVVRRADLDAHATRLTVAGLPPTRIDLAPLPVWNLLPASDSDLALLVADGAQSALVVRRGGRITGLRALAEPGGDPAALAGEARWSLAALGGAPPTIVVAGPDAGPALAAALSAATGARIVPIADTAALQVGSPGQPETDLLTACAVAAGLVAGAGRRARVGLALGGDRHAAPHSSRRVAAFALVALVLGALDLALARQALVRRDAVLTQAIHAAAAAALPGTRIVAPRAQLEAAVAAASRRRARLGGPGSVLEVLHELSTRVPATLRLDLDELAIERDALLLHGRCDSFDAVDALRRALASSPLLATPTAEDTRTTVDGRHVEFRLRAALRPVAGASS